MHPPTTEQEAVLTHGRLYPSMPRKISAFAGTGKTTTLEMLAQVLKGRILYIVFSRPMREEAQQRFPKSVQVRTAHSLAYAALDMQTQRSRLERRLFPEAVQQLVKLPRALATDDSAGFLVLDALARFCNSADPVITAQHVDPAEPPELREDVANAARALWQRMIDPKDDCPISHDTYLKQWQLTGKGFPRYDHILFDEAQDSSPVMLDVMRRQAAPVTWVGDPHQQIYRFRGAVNAMGIVSGAPLVLSQSFRFGPAIAGVANAILACKPAGTRPEILITGDPNRHSTLGPLPGNGKQQPPHAFLSRTNAEWLQHALRLTVPVHVIGGLEEPEALLRAAWHLWSTNRHPPRCPPAIKRFRTWRALCEHTERFRDGEIRLGREIVEHYRERLPGALDRLRARHVAVESEALVTLGTAHRVKGKQYRRVKLGQGFASPADPGWTKLTAAEQEDECNLLYVGVSRAIEHLEPNDAVLACLDVAGFEHSSH